MAKFLIKKQFETFWFDSKLLIKKDFKGGSSAICKGGPMLKLSFLQRSERLRSSSFPLDVVWRGKTQ
jgi:hypothetical protein